MGGGEEEGERERGKRAEISFRERDSKFARCAHSQGGYEWRALLLLVFFSSTALFADILLIETMGARLERGPADTRANATTSAWQQDARVLRLQFFRQTRERERE